MHTRIDRFVCISPDPKLLGRKLKMKFYIEEEGKDMYFEGQVCSYNEQTGVFYGTAWYIFADEEDVMFFQACKFQLQVSSISSSYECFIVAFLIKNMQVSSVLLILHFCI